jgi:hypothetical protein
MDESDNVFPMDVTDPSSRPWKFQATGFLVAILADTAEAQRAEVALIEGGFLPQDIKLYTGNQTLENNVVYMERRDVTAKVVGAIIDDSEGLELYLDYAREDRCALWLRLPDESVVPKVLRVLADFDYLHARYYGDDKHTDFHIS